MIITQEKSKRVVQSHDFDSVKCSIDAEDMRYVASLLRNNYSNPSLAVVREISANALDANLEANASKNIVVTLPTNMNPNFCVRDFGGGLSKEDVFGLYSKYGKSTKRDSNNYIGAFGIGKFAPLSYGSNFTCVSFHGGEKISYNIFVNEEDDTNIVEMHREPSNEPTGLQIEVPVADSDINKFREVVFNFFQFFDKSEMPTFKGLQDDKPKSYEIVMQSNAKDWFIIDSENNSRYGHYGRVSNSHAFMGRVHYPINADSINFKGLISDEQEAQDLKEIASQDNMYIRFDIGELKLHHSRESLEYNKPTQLALIKKLRSVKNDIEEIAKEKLSNADCLWDAKTKYAQVLNALPYTLQNLFRSSFSWKNMKISSPSFDRPYNMHEGLIITEFTKTSDPDATDGYKVASRKTNRVMAHKGSMLLVQDLASGHGNALRARTLFNQNEDIEDIFCVHPMSAEADDHVWKDKDGWRFDLISKQKIYNTSDTPKAKLQVGTRTSGESRASVPTFQFATERVWRQRDHWLNGDEVDTLESSLKGDDKLVYVAISNYKPVDVSYDLDGLSNSYTMIQGMLKGINCKEKITKLHGIRKKDVDGLDKTKWIHWDEYRVLLAKRHLTNNKKMLLMGEKSISYKENHQVMASVKKIENLLANNIMAKAIRNNFDESHPITQIVDTLEISQKDDVVLNTLFRLKQLVEKEDKEWFDQNFPKSYDWRTFEALAKAVVNKYPLLHNISCEVYGWQNLRELDFDNNIIQYISMCDKVGGTETAPRL